MLLLWIPQHPGWGWISSSRVQRLHDPRDTEGSEPSREPLDAAGSGSELGASPRRAADWLAVCPRGGPPIGAAAAGRGPSSGSELGASPRRAADWLSVCPRGGPPTGAAGGRLAGAAGKLRLIGSPAVNKSKSSSQ